MRPFRRSCFFRFFGTFLLTLLLLQGWRMLRTTDLLHQWTRGPALPSPATHLVIIWHSTLYAQAPTGETIAVELTPGAAWHTQPLPGTDTSHAQQTHRDTCDRTDQRFAWYTRPPLGAQQCLETLTHYGDGG